MYWLETEMKKGAHITEKDAAKKLKDIQRFLIFYFISFGIIS